MSADDQAVKCPNCDAEIGEAVNIDGLVMLRVGVLLIRDTSAFCVQCGRFIRWSVSDKILARIVKSAMMKQL